MKKFFIIILTIIIAIFTADCQTQQVKPLTPKPLPQKKSISGQPQPKTNSQIGSPMGGSNDYKSSAESLANSIVDGIDTFAKTAVSDMHSDIEGYPNLSFLLGASRYTGEFARLKWNLGGWGGLSLYGSVGKDWLLNLPNKDKLAWNFGLGFYQAWPSAHAMYANNAVCISLAFGETPIMANYGLLAEFEYEHWFGDSGRFGVFGSVGFGLGDTEDKDGKFIGDIAVGIAVKLWQQ